MIYLGVVAVSILDSLRRMRGDSAAYSISMWVMEFLVLALIAYEVYAGIRERRESHKRQRIVDERVRAVREAISKGQKIHSSAVTIGHTETAAWHQRAIKWTADTQGLTASYSAQAEASFLDVSEALPINAYGSIGDPQEYSHLLATFRRKNAFSKISPVR
jgi:hypothetical protein